MEKGKQLVYPRVAFDKNGHITTWDKEFQGLTKREYFAGLAMQGILSRDPGRGGVDADRLIAISVSYADTLLEALNKE